MRFTTGILSLILCVSLYCQIPGHRLTNWKNAGTSDTVFSSLYVNAIDFKGPNFNGRLDSMLNEAVNLLSANGGGTVLIPEGNFYFSQPVLLKNHVRIKGSGQNTKIHLKFGANAWNGFELKGQALNYNLHFDSIKGNRIYLSQSLQDSSVRLLKFTFNDSNLMNDPWAFGSAGQLLKISSVNGNVLSVSDSVLYEDFSALHPYLIPINPIIHSAVECLYIERDDSADYQASSILLDYAVDCHISGIESNKTNFSHININRSAYNSIERNYLHHSFGYGGGGEGYGVVLQSGSYKNLVTDNIFVHLRHSILLQSGANSNVTSYNSSVDPFVTDNILNDAGGDLVCHGNYTYRNLFEGNVVQTGIIDNSHGKNGYYNTFFRNRFELYGIICSSGQDSQNFIGNEVTNTSSLKGQFALNGSGHYHVSNTVKGNSADTKTDFPKSLYLQGLPDFWNIPYRYFGIGYPNTYLFSSNPARIRYADSSALAPCEIPNKTTKAELIKGKPLIVFPNPVITGQMIMFTTIAGSLKIYNISGEMIYETQNTGHINTDNLTSGIYILSIDSIFIKLIIL